MGRKGKQPSFPYQQMAILSVCRFAEPVASTSVNPYIPEMVASFNVPTDKIGMYSGWLSAVFSLSQAVTGIAWGRASDKVGRKPMIIFALLSIMISSVLFGFSTSLAMAIVTRSVQGASSGNVGIIRTAVAEMVPEKELQPRAFSVMPLIWNIGSIFGPSVGGFLSNPQRRGWFMGSDLLKTYPFALPNLTISFLFVVGIFTGLLFLKETHATLKYRKDYGLMLGSLLTESCSKRTSRHLRQFSDEARPFLGDTESMASSPVATKSPRQKTETTAQPMWRDIFSRQSSINLLAYTGLAMHSVAFDQLMPVFMHHPVQARSSPDVRLPFQFAGGFGLNSGQIGVLFTAYGVFGMMVQFFLFPPLARKFGVLNCFKVCALTFPCVYLVIPFTSLLSTSRLRQGVCLALMLVKCAAGIFAFPCSTILLTNSAASLSVLGTLNGVATSISASGRAAGPALTGWAFTFGVDTGYLVVPFWTLLTISVIAAIPIWLLVEMDGFSTKPSGEDEERDFDDEHEAQEQVRMEDLQRATVKQTSGLGILAGTEAADLLDDDLPVVRHQIMRNGGDDVKHTDEAIGLAKATSLVDTGPQAESVSLTNRHSVIHGTTTSDLGTASPSSERRETQNAL